MRRRDELAPLYPNHVNSKGLRCLGAPKAHVAAFRVFCPVSGKALPCCGGAA